VRQIDIENLYTLSGCDRANQTILLASLIARLMASLMAWVEQIGTDCVLDGRAG
jgi:hypothetical protein